MQFWIGNVVWKVMSGLSLLIRFTSWVLNHDVGGFNGLTCWLECDVEAGSYNVSKPETASGVFVFFWQRTNLRLIASSIKTMLNSTANSSHFPFFLSSEVAMVYPRKLLATNLLSSFLLQNQHIKCKLILHCTDVDTEANKLSTQQSQVIIYTPQPGRLVRTGRSRPLCETSVSVDDLRRGGRYHGGHAWPVSWQVMTSV